MARRPGILARVPVVRLHARQPAWLQASLAAVSVVLGAVIVIRPTTALDLLAVLLGAGMILSGALELTGRADDAGAAADTTAPSATAADSAPSRRWWAIPVALAWVGGGVFVLLWPGLTVRAVAGLVGVLLLVSGTLGVVSAFRRGRGWDARIADAAFGASGLIFGVIGLFWPDITLLVVAVVFGASLLMRGIADLWTLSRRRRRRRHPDAEAKPRWGRTVLAVGSLALAIAVAALTAPLRDGSSVTDPFYAAPRDMPATAGHLVRAEEFTRAMPSNSRAWRILYTTTGVDGRVRVASGLVIVPKDAEPGQRFPTVAWDHGTTGFAEHCAPSVQDRPLWSGGMYFPSKVINQGWAMVAPDYIGLGTQGPHPYLFGEPSAHATLDAVRAAWELTEAQLSRNTVVWGHSQGGGAALWTGALRDEYAPRVAVRGVAALAPASDPPSLVEGVTEITGGSIFASFAFQAFSEIEPDVSYGDYIRPGAQTVVRAMAQRCLTDPGTIVSVLAAVGMSTDPDIFAKDPTTGPLGAALRHNAPPSDIGMPLFIGQGADDSVVPARTQDGYVERLCRAGQTVDYRVYDGFEHAQVMESYSPLVDDLLAWTKARFEGRPADPGCRRTDG
ncbi:lipase family protein [Microbacterium telephonicum]|uniref:Uncharacterized membrane protein HdeD (DUF308 family) n=1 Tax=Microbacterium telephonicum TaxID=1714841 RepID=A0A498BUP4_9MICO|nr:lipase family protein [Microbacterium telephonicum]RLK46639.1 uncharacterized membrane protein HdeD (DUF308 family) [Microbacterium telephonicum]